jgi:hypothetical protein
VNKKSERQLDSSIDSSAGVRGEELQHRCNRLIQDLQHIDRMLIDLMLFIDTHPMDFSARQQYVYWSQQRVMLKQEYQQCCGPLEWYGPGWWNRALGYGYDPLDECFELPPAAIIHRVEED